jgi:hypothetical protein
MLQERFELAHYPASAGVAYRFCVRLFHKGSKTNFSEGFGRSVTIAGKEARKKREASK